jgi:hypothetical protein
MISLEELFQHHDRCPPQLIPYQKGHDLLDLFSRARREDFVAPGWPCLLS